MRIWLVFVCIPATLRFFCVRHTLCIRIPSIQVIRLEIYNVKVWLPECLLIGGKSTLQKHFGTKDGVRCLEFRGCHFSEVANVLQVWDFQSVTRTLSALGSMSASAQGGSTVVAKQRALWINPALIALSIMEELVVDIKRW